MTTTCHGVSCISHPLPQIFRIFCLSFDGVVFKYTIIFFSLSLHKMNCILQFCISPKKFLFIHTQTNKSVLNFCQHSNSSNSGYIKFYCFASFICEYDVLFLSLLPFPLLLLLFPFFTILSLAKRTKTYDKQIKLFENAASKSTNFYWWHKCWRNCVRMLFKNALISVQFETKVCDFEVLPLFSLKIHDECFLFS